MKTSMCICVIVVSMCLSNRTATAGIQLDPIYPNADSFVYSSVPAFNYGTGTNLLVSKAIDGSGHVSGERQSYLKFSLSSLAGYNSADVISIKLNLYVTTSSEATVAAYHSGDTWAETDITWNNKPSLSGEPYMGTSPNLARNQYHSIDLFSAGTGWLAGDIGDGNLSVALLLPDDPSSSVSYYFSSKETNPAYPNYPYLAVEVVPEPTMMCLLGLGVFVMRRCRP
jgi:hypothetical protein